MILRCPHCGFVRETDPARIPPGAAEATCPRCRQSFSMAQVHGLTKEILTPAASLPKAGFWIRLGAFLLDIFILGGIGILTGMLLGSGLEALTSLNDPSLEWVVDRYRKVLMIAYFVFFTAYGGQTPGKMVFGLKVIRTDGTELGFGRAVLREIVGKLVSWLLLMIGYLMVAFDSRKQGLHDKIAKTYVIRL